MMNAVFPVWRRQAAIVSEPIRFLAANPGSRVRLLIGGRASALRLLLIQELGTFPAQINYGGKDVDKGGSYAYLIENRWISGGSCFRSRR
jgi:hypothetical protein